MTSSNIVDTGHQNGHEKSPEEIQLEIARTRSAITEDLLALSEKLSPQHLKEGAREVIRDAKEEAKDILREAKDAAIDSLRGAKDRALDSVNETVNVVGERARHASALTVSFVSAHALTLSLLGLGAGWLALALRQRYQRYRLGSGAAEDYEPSLEDELLSEGLAGDAGLARHDRVRSTATRASRAVDQARARVRSSAHDVVEGASELRQRAAHTVRHAAARTRETAADHRVAAVALTVAAGLGLGLLLPIGQRPRRALRRTGERLWDEAEALGREASWRTRRASAELREAMRAPSGY